MNDIERAKKVAAAVARKGGRVYYVGGYARDQVWASLGHSSDLKDIDLEVYGVPLVDLKVILSKIGTIDTVGAHFGVIKFKHSHIDISVPRRDSKKGVGHKGFMVDTDLNMSVQEAARRRDFTINTLAIDVLSGELIDSFGAVEDLRNGILRATDPALFGDDPLRVLRAMQFAARFDLALEPATLQLCKRIDLHDLPPERIGEEWKKLLLMSARPSLGLDVAKDVGILSQLLPQLDILDSIPQDPRWHPEGSVWVHTKQAVDYAAGRCRREQFTPSIAYQYMLAVLCHDTGKATTTTLQPDGRITSYGHDQSGIEPTKQLLKQLAVSHHIRKSIVQLVANHMFPLTNETVTNSALRRLAQRLHPATITQLLLLAEADLRGRGDVHADISALASMSKRAQKLQVAHKKPAAIIQGRDLIDLGVSPGPDMGKLLKLLFEKQLSGEFTDHETGMQCAREFLNGWRVTIML